VSQVPDGFLPLWLAVLAYIFFYYCALLGVALNTESTGWHGTVVTIGNISVNFVIMLLFGLPSVRSYGEGPVAIWAADVVSLGVAAIAGGIVALGIAMRVYVCRSEFV
jgi:hypothetical protein